MHPTQAAYEAKALLASYLRTTFEHAGLAWTEANNADVAHLVEALIAAAQSERD